MRTWKWVVSRRCHGLAPRMPILGHKVRRMSASDDAVAHAAKTFAAISGLAAERPSGKGKTTVLDIRSPNATRGGSGRFQIGCPTACGRDRKDARRPSADRIFAVRRRGWRRVQQRTTDGRGFERAGQLNDRSGRWGTRRGFSAGGRHCAAGPAVPGLAQHVAQSNLVRSPARRENARGSTGNALGAPTSRNREVRSASCLCPARLRAYIKRGR